jgi:hypothetical protein
MADEKPAIEYNTDNIPNALPILPLFDATLFPQNGVAPGGNERRIGPPDR